MPCGHFCVCNDCGVSLRLSPTRSRCPLCRKEVQDIVKIDVDVPAQPAPTPEPGADDTAAPVAESPAADVAADADVVPTSHETAGSVGSDELSLEQLRAARVQRLGGDAPKAEEGAVASTTSATSAASTAGAAASSNSGLPPRCLQRLMRELRTTAEQREKLSKEDGVELDLADPEGSDLRVWLLRLMTPGIDPQSALGKQLRQFGVPAIDIEVWVPDGFPYEPPRLRILKPSFSTGSFWVQTHGALCLEVLTKQGWSPAMSLPQLGVHVKTMMSQVPGGTISGTGAIGGSRESAWATSTAIEASHQDWNPFSTK